MDEETYKGLPPELVEALMAGALTEEELAAVDKKLAQAEALRNQMLTAPEGRSSGRVYTAANPLEHIGRLMQGYQGMKQAKALDTQRGGILDAERKRQREYADAVLYPKGRPMKPLESLRGWSPEMPAFDPNSIPAPKKYDF